EHGATIHGAYTKSGTVFPHRRIHAGLTPGAPSGPPYSRRAREKCGISRSIEVCRLEGGPDASGFAPQDATATGGRAGDGGYACAAPTARAKEHLAAVDHDAPDLDVGGALLFVRAPASHEWGKGGQHFASRPRSGSCHQTAGRVGQDQRLE